MGDSDEDFVAIGDALVQVLERRAGLGRHSRLLDVGCGYGRLAHALLRSGFEGTYLGVDVLPAPIDWSNDHLAGSRTEFRVLDVSNGRYNPDGGRDMSELEAAEFGRRFDTIALFSLITHLWPEDVTAYLRLIAALLKPGGTALITAFLLDETSLELCRDGRADLRFAHRRLEHCRYESQEAPLHHVGYDLEWLLAEASRYGLRPSGEVCSGFWSGRPLDLDTAGYQDEIAFELGD